MSSDHGTSPLDALAGATGWLNSPPLGPPDLRGRVVLVEFWTYTCINWLRCLPYTRAWAARYREHGLVVIGVHTPEFGFEGDIANVRRAARELGVDYPVAVDSDYAIWNGFGNRYWPARYLLDAGRRIRHQHFGEGDYEGSERAIQRLISADDGGLTEVTASRARRRRGQGRPRRGDRAAALSTDPPARSGH